MTITHRRFFYNFEERVYCIKRCLADAGQRRLPDSGIQTTIDGLPLDDCKTTSIFINSIYAIHVNMKRRWKQDSLPFEMGASDRSVEDSLSYTMIGGLIMVDNDAWPKMRLRAICITG